jgi:cell division septation protein DedD
MAATTRRSRNYKEKNSMFAFGHFALPVAAVVALGLLFIGIKLFFLTPSERVDAGFTDVTPRLNYAAEAEREPLPDIEPLPLGAPDPAEGTLIASGAGVSTVQVTPPPVVQEPRAETITAGPIASGAAAARPEARVSEPSPRNTPRTGASAGRTPARTAPSPADSKWAVQVGAFVNQGSAASLVDQIRKQGYTAAVSKSDMSGKTYHRVRVPAGDSRESANRLAAELERKGYPVAVVPVR